MPTTADQPTHLGDLAREMDSPAAVIWTSMHVMKRHLDRITNAVQGSTGSTHGFDTEGDSDPDIGQLRDCLDLAIAAGERLVKSNRNLQRAIHLHEESCEERSCHCAQPLLP